MLVRKGLKSDFNIVFVLKSVLKYVELKHTYKKVWDVLTSIPNSAQGAYDAGYYFCYYYEVPANRESSSVSRGTLAAETFFPEYS